MNSIEKWNEKHEAEEAERQRVVAQNGNSGLHYVSSTTEASPDIQKYVTTTTKVEKGTSVGDQLKFNFWGQEDLKEQS
tara:strand:+ start:588 stop:821 length:234 start_codon:yes stop_codon:yes gene_type:complete